NALRKAELMMITLQRRRRRISQTMEQMSCTYICSMIPRGLISCSKASRKASNSSADSVISNGDFGRSANSFLRRILLTPLNLPVPGSWRWANVLLHATNHSHDSTDLRSEPRQMQPSSSLRSTPDHGSTGTYLCRPQMKGAAWWRNRCRIGGGGCR